MKRFLSLFLLLCVLLVFPALGEETVSAPERFDSDTLTWEFDGDTGTLFIHGSGPMRSYRSDCPEWEQYKDVITCVRLDEGVTSVGAYAFYDYESLQTAFLPDSIEIVDDCAFYYCWELRSITIPRSLHYVGEGAFYNTLLHEPADIVFPEGLEYIGNEAFHSAMKTDGRYVLPSTLRYIGTGAFSNAMISDIVVSEDNPCYKSENHALLTKDGTELLLYCSCAEETVFCVPEGVKKLDAESFNVVRYLEKLVLPSTVTEIEEGAVFCNYNLTEISVAEGNTAYKVVDGYLCTADGKTCLAFPDGIVLTEIVLPEGVERLGAYVFYGRYGEAVAVTLPSTLRSIGRLSLPWSISTLTVPKGLETIDDYGLVFEGGVGEVLYAGSEKDWQAIEIGEGNVGLDSAVIHYNR